jgi:hypothetical protein
MQIPDLEDQGLNVVEQNLIDIVYEIGVCKSFKKQNGGACSELITICQRLLYFLKVPT